MVGGEGFWCEVSWSGEGLEMMVGGGVMGIGGGGWKGLCGVTGWSGGRESNHLPGKIRPRYFIIIKLL